MNKLILLCFMALAIPACQTTAQKDPFDVMLDAKMLNMAQGIPN